VVIATELSGSCCEFGYNDIDPTFDYTPTVDELMTATDWLRPTMIQRLTALGLL
jgi:hypothetical protein